MAFKKGQRVRFSEALFTEEPSFIISDGITRDEVHVVLKDSQDGTSVIVDIDGYGSKGNKNSRGSFYSKHLKAAPKPTIFI